MNTKNHSLKNNSSVSVLDLARTGFLVGVGVGEALTARLVEKSGFDFVWASSLAIAASLGIPEERSIESQHCINRVREIARAVRIPIIVDSPISYLNMGKIKDLVKNYDLAGVSAVCIEDKAGPKTNSLDHQKPQVLMPVDEFLRRCEIVRDTSKKLLLIARVEALVAGLDVEEALMRMERYAGAGVDGIIIHSRAPVPDEIVGLIKNWQGQCPLGLIPTTYPSLTETAIAQLQKVKFVIYANQLLRASLKAQLEVLQEIKLTGRIDAIDNKLLSIRKTLTFIEQDQEQSLNNVK